MREYKVTSTKHPIHIATKTGKATATGDLNRYSSNTYTRINETAYARDLNKYDSLIY